MYLLNVTTIVENEKVAPYRASHKAWVQHGIDKGWFIFAGPKSNRDGGLILVKEVSLDKLQAFIAKDPYIKEKLAQYQLIDFSISLSMDGFDQFVLKG